MSSGYTKMDLREHVLHRPDMYIGSTTLREDKLWLVDDIDNTNIQGELTKVTFVPGLIKIFDEVLLNAAEHHLRDDTVKSIRVTINEETSSISIWNDGKGIPVVMHRELNIYIPELIFGKMGTGGNFDGTDGHHGLGAKLTNIFSSEFTIETADTSRSRKFKQTFMNNMADRTIPEITICTESYTKVTFKPDYKRFNIQGLDADHVKILKSRVYEVAGCNSELSVFLNGKEIMFDTFADYARLFTQSAHKCKAFYGPEVIMKDGRKRWEVCVALNTTGVFHHISFANLNRTTYGGTHVNHVSKAIVKYLIPIIKERIDPSSKIKVSQIKNQLFLFINCLIVNPLFDSQSKEKLVTREKQFGCSAKLGDAFLEKISKSGIVDQVLCNQT